jgi:hypothetical protein
MGHRAQCRVRAPGEEWRQGCMAQEKPTAVNAGLTKWLATKPLDLMRATILLERCRGEPIGQRRNNDSLARRHTKERLVASRRRLTAVHPSVGEDADELQRQQNLLNFRRLTIHMRFAVCVDSSHAASVQQDPLAIQLH